MDEWIKLDYDTSDEEEKKANQILKEPLFTYKKPEKEINLWIYYINLVLICLLYFKTYYPDILLEWL
jgi:hypothetical protein